MEILAGFWSLRALFSKIYSFSQLQQRELQDLRLKTEKKLKDHSNNKTKISGFLVLFSEKFGLELLLLICEQ